MADLETFNTNENATTVRTKINDAIRRINSLDDGFEIVAKIDTELGSTNWKDSALTFTTVATLKAFDIGGLANNTVAVILGNNTIGDGAGAVYFWSAGSGQTADGRDVISPNIPAATGRWLIVGVASARRVLNSIDPNNDVNDSALATHSAIKNYIDENSTSSDLVYVPVISVSTPPTVTGSFGSVTGLSYDSGYLNGSANGSAEYFLNDLKTTAGGDIANIRAVHIEVDVRMNVIDESAREASLTVTYPDGTTQPLLIADWEDKQGETRQWVNQIATVPVNSDTDSFTITGDINGSGVGERIAYKIVGATTILNASGLTTTQVFGNSGLLYSGVEVFNGSVAADTWVEGVNLLPAMGGKAGRYKVTLKWENTDGALESISVRPGDETIDLGRLLGFGKGGGGTSGADIDTGHFAYLQVLTDEQGLIDLKIDQGGTCAVTLESYMPLDDVPVVTNHFLGDVEFIDPVDIVTPASGLTGTTGWITVPSNLAWAGASTLLMTASVENTTSGPLDATLLVRSENGATATPIITLENLLSSAQPHVQSLAPVTSTGNFQYNWSHGNGPNQIQLTSLRVVGYIKSDIKTNAYPYYNVKVHPATNITTPAGFIEDELLGTYREPSFGSIGNTITFTAGNSLMYEMTVNAVSDTTVLQDLAYFGGDIRIYVDGTLKYTYTGIIYGGDTNADVIQTSFPLTTGTHLIQIITSDEGSGNQRHLLGDIISDTVQFIGFSGSPDILDEDDMVTDSETALATQQSIKAYVDNSKPLFNVRYETAAGVGGPTVTTGTVENVNFNSVALNEIGVGASLDEATNTISLPAGTYDIRFVGVTFASSESFSLYNKTLSTSPIPPARQMSKTLFGRVVVPIGGPHEFVVKHHMLQDSGERTFTSQTTTYPDFFDHPTDIYNEALIWKIK